ncbi:MAG: hypothetical protein IID41_00505 [Planctomycetes bacterium]|nr:hypothetical protein [Planctomycetota bacterium]
MKFIVGLVEKSGVLDALDPRSELGSVMGHLKIGKPLAEVCFVKRADHFFKDNNYFALGTDFNGVVAFFVLDALRDLARCQHFCR